MMHLGLHLALPLKTGQKLHEQSASAGETQSPVQ